MSFGYGVGDVIGVAALCWKAYKKCKDSSGEFKDIAVEMSCLHSVLKETDEVLSEQNLSSQQQARLKPIKEGILGLLHELEQRLERYESLGTQSKRTLDRVGWAMDIGVAELRQKLIAQTTLLDSFNNSASHSRLEHKLNQLISEVRAGKRQGSVISSQTFDSNVGDTWEELRRELEDIGISADVIREKRTFIVAWFEEAIASGRIEEDEPERATNDEIYPGDEEEPGQHAEISGINEENQQRKIPQPQSKAISRTESSQSQTARAPRKKATRSQLSYLLYALRLESPNARLFKAARNGDVEKVEQLLEGGANVDYAQDSTGQTVLHIASERGHGSVVELLLSKGSSIDARDKTGCSPLHDAVWKGHEPIVEILLQKWANIDARDKDGWTPLHYAVSVESKTLVEFLLQKGANIEAQGKYSRTPLHQAVLRGREFIEILLNNDANIDAWDKDGWTPLHYAMSVESKTLVEFLLQKGANIEAQDEDGRTPLHYAVWKRYKFVKILLNNGANIDARDKNGWTPLHYAISVESKTLVEFLLQKGANIEAQDEDGGTPLHQAVLKGREFIEILLNNGANIDAWDKSGGTPLHRAVLKVRGEVVNLLLQNGASREAQDFRGRKPGDMITPWSSNWRRFDPDLISELKK